VHAITAESGGDAAVKARLDEREAKDLPFPVHSDPEHKLLMNPQEGYYVKEFNPAKDKFGGDYTDYEMVQPAIEILDKTGAVVQKWSWYSFEPTPDMKKIVNKVKTKEGEEIMLVCARPVADDILPSIKENRDVKIHAAMTF